MRTTISVPSVSVASRFASAENSSGGVSRITQLKTLRKASMRVLDLAHIEEFQRVPHLGTGRHEIEIRPLNAAHTVFKLTVGQQEVGKSGGPLALEHVMDHGAPKIEIGDQDRRFELCLRQRQIDRRERLAFGGRGAGYNNRVQILLALHVIQTRPQTAELFAGNFMRALDVDEVRFRRGLNGIVLQRERKFRQST